MPPLLDIRQKAAILLALFAGLRRGEIRGLRWSDIDLKTKQIDVQHNVVRFDGDKAPKKDSTNESPGDMLIISDFLTRMANNFENRYRRP